MQVKIVREFSLYLNKMKYRVWVGDILFESFDSEIEAKSCVSLNRETWAKNLLPETIYTEEI